MKFAFRTGQQRFYPTPVLKIATAPGPVCWASILNNQVTTQRFCSNTIFNSDRQLFIHNHSSHQLAKNERTIRRWSHNKQVDHSIIYHLFVCHLLDFTIKAGCTFFLYAKQAGKLHPVQWTRHFNQWKYFERCDFYSAWCICRNFIWKMVVR